MNEILILVPRDYRKRPLENCVISLPCMQVLGQAKKF